MLHFNAPNCLLSTKVILPKEISNIAVISIVKNSVWKYGFRKKREKRRHHDVHAHRESNEWEKWDRRMAKGHYSFRKDDHLFGFEMSTKLISVVVFSNDNLFIYFINCIFVRFLWRGYSCSVAPLRDALVPYTWPFIIF